MNALCIGLGQLNLTVGALEANGLHVVEAAKRARSAGAELIVFPELAICGYPPEDLVLKRHFIEDVAERLRGVARELPKDAVVLVGAPVERGEGIVNGAAILHGGEWVGTYAKQMLPNYGVFDEKRLFLEGSEGMVLEVGGFRVGVHICEDSWVAKGPACRAMGEAGVDVVVNLSASPYHRGKGIQREATLRAAALEMGAPLAYCNLVGGQDELVFDGGSMVVDPGTEEVVRAELFEEDLLIYGVEKRETSLRGGSGGAVGWETLSFPRFGNEMGGVFQGLETIRLRSSGATPRQALRGVGPLDSVEEVYRALCLGLKDYVEKNGFGRTVIGISGGIDSALVAAIAVDALGASRVVGVTMPSAFSSEGTHGDAHELGRRLGLEFLDVPIRELHGMYVEQLERLWVGRTEDTTEENLQARIRGNIVMALSNKFGWLVLTTGNKSEFATGYCTLYGDMAGGYAVIKDVPKTLVYALSRWRNGVGEERVIPEGILERPPTAELRANQKDSDSLPPYEVLDAILERYVEWDWGGDRIVAEGFDAETVRRVIHLVDGNEYKRRQGPPGIKITPKAFGRDRRLPITNHYSERLKVPRAAKRPAGEGGES